jgi:hypothetical protein
MTTTDRSPLTFEDVKALAARVTERTGIPFEAHAEDELDNAGRDYFVLSAKGEAFNIELGTWMLEATGAIIGGSAVSNTNRSGGVYSRTRARPGRVAALYEDNCAWEGRFATPRPDDYDPELNFEPGEAEWFFAQNPIGKVLEDELRKRGIHLLIDSWS